MDKTETPIRQLPVEILIKIFQFLHSKELKACRDVCDQWLSIIDNIDEIWMEATRLEYPDIYEEAYGKCLPKPSWYDLHHSLSLWSEIGNATESPVQDKLEFDIPRLDDIDFLLLENGIFSICTKPQSNIKYYDINKPDEAIREENTPYPINMYAENEYLIACVNHKKRKLFIKVKKSGKTEQYDLLCRLEMLVLKKNNAFTIDKMKLTQYECNEGGIEAKVLLDVVDRDRIIELEFISYTNCLNLIAMDGDYWNNLVYTKSSEGMAVKEKITMNIFYSLPIFMEYRLLEGIYSDFTVSVQKEAKNKLFNVDFTTVCQYGDVLIAATKEGLIKIYYKPFKDRESKVLPEPSRVIHSFKSFIILKIDVVEIKNGHKLYVAVMEHSIKIKELTLTNM